MIALRTGSWAILLVAVGWPGLAVRAQEPTPLDLDTLVVPEPVAPEARNPQTDIRRLLRPEYSVIEARGQLDRSVHDRTELLVTLREREAVLQADLTRTSAAFDALTAARDAERDVVRERLKTMIRVRRLPKAHVFFDADGFAAYHGRVTALERLYEADRRRIVAYKAQLRGWERARADLERRRTNLARTRKEIAYNEQELAWDQEELVALGAAVVEEPEFYAEYVREIDALDEVVRKKVEEVVDPERPRLFIDRNKGGLSPPLWNADIEGRYGIRKHRAFGIEGTFRGLHLVPNRPGSHENVRAIYWGYVAFTGWIEGLGRVVIIDHTLGYTSLYGHLSSIAVTVGEKVKTGQTIGELGDSGSFFGERLYLELRENGRALNPLPWLK